MKRQFFLFLLMLLLTAGNSPAGGQSLRIEQLKAEILLKLLSQNRSLDFTQIDSVAIAIVYDQTDYASENEALQYRQIFSNFPNPPFKEKALQIQRLFLMRAIDRDNFMHRNIVTAGYVEFGFGEHESVF